MTPDPPPNCNKLAIWLVMLSSKNMHFRAIFFTHTVSITLRLFSNCCQFFISNGYPQEMLNAKDTSERM